MSTGGQGDVSRAASDPGTDPETLRQIAYRYPDLRAAVAGNPTAYPGLLDWLEQLGDPGVLEALRRRRGRDQAAQAGRRAPQDSGSGAPTQVLPPLASSGIPRGGAGRGRIEQPRDLPDWQQPSGGQDRPRGGWQRQGAGRPAPTSWGAGGAGAGADIVTPAQGLTAARGRTSVAVRVGLALWTVLALVLVALVIYLLTGAGRGGGSSQAPSPSASQQSGAASSASARPTKVAFPAPSGATQAAAVTAPSRNILCQLGSDSVSCTIVEQNYKARSFDDCGATQFAITADDASARKDCSAKVQASGAPALPYGASAVNGHSACTSDIAGMTCWNTVSGQSFAVSRQGWMTGSTGAIPSDSFRW